MHRNAELCEALAEALETETARLTPEAVLEDIVADYDSLRMLQLVAVMSERYNIVVDVDRMTACRTVHDLVELIKEHVRDRSASP